MKGMGQWCLFVGGILLLVLIFAAHSPPVPSPSAGNSSSARRPAGPSIASRIVPPGPRTSRLSESEHISDVFNGPRLTPLAHPLLVAASPGCRQLWRTIRNADLDRLFPAAAGPPTLPDAGRCSPPDKLAPYHDQYSQLCRTEPASRSMLERETQLADCRFALILYRAQLTEMDTSGAALDKIRDPRVLADKLVALFDTSPSAAADVADRMLKLDPGQTTAARASVVARFIDADENAASDADPKWLLAAGALERAAKARAAPPEELAEMGVLLTTIRYADPALVTEKAEEIDKAFPASGIGPYYRAWAENQSGRKEDAIRFLREAIKREPGDARYRETLDRLSDTEEREKAGDPFQSHLTFSLGSARH